MKANSTLRAAVLFVLVASFAIVCPAQTSSIGLHMGSDETVTQYYDFSKWLGKPVLFRLTFVSGYSWDTIAAPKFITLGITKQWLASNPGRHEIITVPLSPTSTKQSYLPQLAAGNYDAYFKKLAANICNLTGAPQRVIVRLGWEFNGAWYPWSALGQAAAYKAAFRHVAQVMRTQCTVLHFEWNIAWGTNWTFDWTTAYPGDDIVDVVGMDVYDQYNTYGWYNVLHIYQGLLFMRDFARAHNKFEAYSEWGLSSQPLPVGNGDDLEYVQGMYNWIKAGGSRVRYADYWNSSAGGPNGVIYSDDPTVPVTMPKSAVLYKKLFGQ
jgi:hypothetical protein